MQSVNVAPRSQGPVVSEAGNARSSTKIVLLRRGCSKSNNVATNHHTSVADLALLSKLCRSGSLPIFVRTFAIQTTTKNSHDFDNTFTPLRLRIFFFMTQ